MFGFRHRFGRHHLPAANGLIPLTDLTNGQSGVIHDFQGGQAMEQRLNALGARQGQRLTRIGGMFMRGPITVKIEKSQIAIGFGMAKHILVRVQDENPVDG